MHVASGGENYAAVSLVTNLTTAILGAKNAGYWIAGAVVEDGENVHTAKLPSPLGLVLGSEGKGIRAGVRKHLDLKVILPMHGARLSFNVAIAGALFCQEILQQKALA